MLHDELVRFWIPLYPSQLNQFLKGFRRHKSEFHLDENKPKKYWIYPLHKNSRQLLSSPSPLPEIFQKGTSEGVAGARCALTCKDLGHALGAIVTLCQHEDGRPVAMAAYSGATDDCELPVAQELLKPSGDFLENATITSDALHTPKKRIA